MNRCKYNSSLEEEIMKGLFNFSEVLTYFFRKKDPNRKTNFNLKTMHFINKLSMAIFLIGLIFLIVKWMR